MPSHFKIITRGPILIAFMAMLSLGIADNVRGPLFVDILQDFSLDHSQGSLFFSLASLMVLPGGYLAGYLLKRMSLSQAMSGAVLLMTASLIGFALSKSYFQLLLFVPFFGLALAMQGVIQNVTVLRLAPQEKMQQIQSGLHSMYGLASLLAPLSVTLVRIYRPDWQSVFLVAATFGILTLIVSLQQSRGTSVKAEAPLLTLQETPLLRKQAFVFGLMMAIYVNVEVLLFTHVAQFARENSNWSFADANSLATGFFAALFLGRLVFALIRPVGSLVFQMSLCLVAAGISIVLGAWLNPWCYVLSGLSVAPVYPMGMTVAGDYFKGSVAKVASHTVGISGLTVVLMQTLFGLLTDWRGLPWAMMLGPFFAAVAFLMLTRFSRWTAKQVGA